MDKKPQTIEDLLTQEKKTPKSIEEVLPDQYKEYKSVFEKAASECFPES